MEPDDKANPMIVGIGGRSGSGKTTVVRKLIEHFGSQLISLLTLDNYYLPRDQQVEDESAYLNFDLPSSFQREKFASDLLTLKLGRHIEIVEYVFNNERRPKPLRIVPRPIILVEGLFIFHYQEVREMIDLKVLIDVPAEVAFNRRLQRDLTERNYGEEEIIHRYFQHAEPAFQNFIQPYIGEIDLIVSNRNNMDQAISIVCKEVGALI